MIAPSEEAVARLEPIEDEIELEMQEDGSMPRWLRVVVTIVAIAGVVVLVARFGTRLAKR
jgi:hypothetical protein